MNQVSINLDAYSLVRMFLADPELRIKVRQAINDGPAEKLTEKLGYADLSEDRSGNWHTVFVAARKDTRMGDPSCLVKTKTGLLLANLRKQTQKNMRASQPEQATQSQPVEVDANQLNVQLIAAKLGVSLEQLAMMVKSGAVPETEQSSQDDAGNESPF